MCAADVGKQAIHVGSNNLISFEKVPRRLEGSRDVVTKILGSTIPDNVAYSSSIASSSSTVVVFDSSYLKSSLNFVSFAMDGSNGLPEASDSFNFCRLSVSSAC